MPPCLKGSILEGPNWGLTGVTPLLACIGRQAVALVAGDAVRSQPTAEFLARADAAVGAGELLGAAPMRMRQEVVSSLASCVCGCPEAVRNVLGRLCRHQHGVGLSGVSFSSLPAQTAAPIYSSGFQIAHILIICQVPAGRPACPRQRCRMATTGWRSTSCAAACSGASWPCAPA